MQVTLGTASGDEFVLLVDAHGEMTLTAKRVAGLCERAGEPGARGVIRAIPTRLHDEGVHLLAEVPDATWFMEHWNRNGRAGALCANAIRIFTRFLVNESLITPERRETTSVATLSGVYDVLGGVAGYSVDLGRWRLGGQVFCGERGGVRIHLAGGTYTVIMAASRAELESLPEIGTPPPLLSAQAGGSETVLWVAADERLIHDGVGHLHARMSPSSGAECTSSGTGAAAAAIAFRHLGARDLPHHWGVELPGGKVTVRMFPTEEGEHIGLSGDAEIMQAEQDETSTWMIE